MIVRVILASIDALKSVVLAEQIAELKSQRVHLQQQEQRRLRLESVCQSSRKNGDIRQGT